MYAVGPLQLLLLVAIAGAGAIAGFVASVVILRKRRRARAYFMLGVLTGWLAAAMAHGRYRTPGQLSALAGGFVHPRRIMGRAIGRERWHRLANRAAYQLTSSTVFPTRWP